MAIKDAKVDVVVQRIEEDIGDELDVIPTHVRRYGVNNIFSRVFSYLLGWKADGKPVKLAATVAGALKVASVGAGYEAFEHKEGLAESSLSAAVTFATPVSSVYVFTTDFWMYLYTSSNGTDFYSKMLCKPNIVNKFDVSMHSFKVQQAGINAVEYEIVGVR